jgi:hypothetical protein
MTPTHSTDPEYITKSAILFMVFNRPDTTRHVFEAIRRAKPARLYVAADGPRNDRPGEAVRCEAVRQIASAVDWECEVSTLFRDTNLGCGKAVSQGITWFFEHEEQGIILEDDCLPDLSFFRFVDEVLERYRTDSRVAIVSGDNHQTKPVRDTSSYHFSILAHIWGWGSWRRAWQKYDHAMSTWPTIRDNGMLRDILSVGDSRAVRHWAGLLERTYLGEIDTWDYNWQFACWREGMVNILPCVNLVQNIGYGEDATHTRGSNEGHASAHARPIEFPLRHPVHMIVDRRADQATINAAGTRRSLLRRIVSRMRRGVKEQA